MKAISIILTIGSVVAALLPAHGADPVTPVSRLAIPQGYSAERYEGAWQRNPFLGQVKSPDQAKVSFSRDWALKGMARYDGKVLVMIVNQQTGEVRNLEKGGSTGADAEFELVSAHFSRVREQASAQVRKGNETATLHYQEAKQ